MSRGVAALWRYRRASEQRKAPACFCRKRPLPLPRLFDAASPESRVGTGGRGTPPARGRLGSTFQTLGGINWLKRAQRKQKPDDVVMQAMTEEERRLLRQEQRSLPSAW